jgi:hypothetical protein
VLSGEGGELELQHGDGGRVQAVLVPDPDARLPKAVLNGRDAELQRGGGGRVHAVRMPGSEARGGRKEGPGTAKGRY